MFPVVILMIVASSLWGFSSIVSILSTCIMLDNSYFLMRYCWMKRSCVRMSICCSGCLSSVKYIFWIFIQLSLSMNLTILCCRLDTVIKYYLPGFISPFYYYIAIYILSILIKLKPKVHSSKNIHHFLWCSYKCCLTSICKFGILLNLMFLVMKIGNIGIIIGWQSSCTVVWIISTLLDCYRCCLLIFCSLALIVSSDPHQLVLLTLSWTQLDLDSRCCPCRTI